MSVYIQAVSKRSDRDFDIWPPNQYGSPSFDTCNKAICEVFNSIEWKTWSVVSTSSVLKPNTYMYSPKHEQSSCFIPSHNELQGNNYGIFKQLVISWNMTWYMDIKTFN